MEEGNKKKYGDINLSDNELFISVMKNKKACEIVLNIILQRKTNEIRLKNIEVEKIILNDEGKRAIRLDVYANEEDNTLYDLEMQQEINDNLPKRARFYQSLLDSPILKSGKETKYKQLPKTYIIFITKQDFLGQDLACYTFVNYCKEKELELGDDAIKIFLNMASKKGDDALIQLLQYMKDTNLENHIVSGERQLNIDSRIKELDVIVDEVKESEEWEVVHMTILEKGKEIGKEIGSEEHLFRQIISKYHKGYQAGTIAEHLEISEDKANSALRVIKEHPEYTAEELVKMIHSNNMESNSK